MPAAAASNGASSNGNGKKKSAQKKKVAVARATKTQAACMRTPRAPRPATLRALPRSSLLGSTLRVARMAL